MWTNLNYQSATIEQVFKPLYDKSIEYNRQWSIAELRLSEEDLKWLLSWFYCQTLGNDLIYSISKLSNEISLTYRLMFGSLFICAGAETCREKSNEDSIWPVMRSILPKSHGLYREFFLSNGLPSPLIKDIIADAVRALNLRHVMDIEGTQQWFVTIKLQIGFTYSGAKKRLAEWLVNLGQPHAVQYLNGDSSFPELSSESFQSLWRALTQYRRNLISDIQIRETLNKNPWIKKHWLNDLLKEAKAKLSTLGTGGENLDKNKEFQEESSDEEFNPISDIGLEWLSNNAPRLRFHLNKQAIEELVSGTEINELDFYIDGKRVCRWLRQRDNSWAGEEQIYAEQDKDKMQPNLYPRTFVLMSISGEIHEEWDCSESGLSEEVLIFDMERGRIVTSGFERLEPNHQYVIICNRDCEVKNCIPIKTFVPNKSLRKAIALPSPLNTNLCIVYNDFILWQPIQEKYDSLHFTIKLTAPTDAILALNERLKLILTGIPENAESVKLLIHKNIFDVQKDLHNNTWYTLKEITITPELLTRQRRVRVRFTISDKVYNQEPRLEFRVSGAAMLCYEHENDTQTISFKVLKHGDQLNRAEGTTSLRIWTPDQNKGAVFEGDCHVRLLRRNKIRLRDLPGHGGELYIMSQGERYNLKISCIDKGCINSFNPSMLGCDAQISLLSEKDPTEISDDGYGILMWNLNEKNKAKFQKVSVNKIQPGSSGRIWKIKDTSNPMAIALTWKGTWLGAWWNIDRIYDYINNKKDLSEHDFAILKWFRVPILHPTISTALKKIILYSPCQFIRSWKMDIGLPEIVQPHDDFPEIDFIVRHFLWNQFLTGYAEEVIALITQKEIHWYLKDCIITYLRKLSDISPLLLWKGIEKCIKYNQNTISNLLKIFINEQVGLIPADSQKRFKFRLEELKKRVLVATGFNSDRLEKIISLRIKSLIENQWNSSEQDRLDLLKLGQTQSGRKYLSAQIGQYWLVLSRK